MTEWSDGRKNRGARTRGERGTGSRRNERSASRFIGSTVKKLRLASRPPVLHSAPHCWRNVLRTRNEITARKRDSPRLPSGQIRISSGDKPARDSVHRSWTSRISFLLATRRNHGADAFVDDSPSERQFERERSLPMDRGRRTFGRRASKQTTRTPPFDSLESDASLGHYVPRSYDHAQHSVTVPRTMKNCG